MYKIQFADQEIEYSIKISRLARKISLHLTSHGVKVVIPSKRFVDEAHKFVVEKAAWIIANTHKAHVLHDGDVVKILGEDFTIKHEKWALAKTRVGEHNNVITLYSPDPIKDAQVEISDYLRKKYSKLIKYRVAELAELHGFAYKSISIRDQSSRWGSCSSEKALNFSWRLILAPVEIMDYVIIHELAHTVHLNHSDQFWNLVEKHFPGYKQARLWLKRNHYLLSSY